MIVLVGVAHVIDVSQQIGQLVSYYLPGAVGVELDPSRYQALRDGERSSNVPLAYRLLSLMQRRLAEQFGGADQAFAELQTDNFEDLFVGFDLACDHLLLQARFAELIPRLGDGGA